jgi:hypothetical protein
MRRLGGDTLEADPPRGGKRVVVAREHDEWIGQSIWVTTSSLSSGDVKT